MNKPSSSVAPESQESNIGLTKQDIIDLKEYLTCLYEFVYKGDWRVCKKFADDKETEDRIAKILDKLTLVEMLAE
jgi:hypothetical protein